MLNSYNNACFLFAFLILNGYNFKLLWVKKDDPYQ